MKKFYYLLIVVFGICVTSCSGNGKSNGKEGYSVLDDSSQEISNDINPKEVVLSIELKNMDGLGEFVSFGKVISIKFLNENEAEDDFPPTVNLVATMTVNVDSAVCSTRNFMYHYSVLDKNSTEIANLGFNSLDWEPNQNDREYYHYLNKGVLSTELQIDDMITKEQWKKIIKEGVSVVIEPECSYYNDEEVAQYKPYAVSEE